MNVNKSIQERRELIESIEAFYTYLIASKNHAIDSIKAQIDYLEENANNLEIVHNEKQYFLDKVLPLYGTKSADHFEEKELIWDIVAGRAKHLDELDFLYRQRDHPNSKLSVNIKVESIEIEESGDDNNE